MLTAIIVAAGSSRRFGFDKLTAVVGGKPVIVHTVAAFELTSAVADIVIVTRGDRVAEFQQLLGGLSKVRCVIEGGEHRHDSVALGLRQLRRETDFVSVHDGARPLVTSEQIEQVFEQARLHGGASLAEPVRDTLKRAGDDRFVTGSVDRHGLYAMQTPQIFDRALLEQAYQAVARTGQTVTDEASAVELLGRAVVLVENADVNLKITFQRDLELAEAVLLHRQSPV